MVAWAHCVREIVFIDNLPAKGTMSAKRSESEKTSKVRDECYRIGTWNVRALKGKEHKMIEEMKKYRINIRAVSEIKWRGRGAKDVECYKVVYSGIETGRAREGVAMVFSE